MRPSHLKLCPQVVAPRGDSVRVRTRISQGLIDKSVGNADQLFSHYRIESRLLSCPYRRGNRTY